MAESFLEVRADKEESENCMELRQIQSIKFHLVSPFCSSPSCAHTGSLRHTDRRERGGHCIGVGRGVGWGGVGRSSIRTSRRSPWPGHSSTVSEES